MEDLEDILYDDVEAKYLTLQNKKKNRKKRRRKRRWIGLLVIGCVLALYFVSDVSKVKSLDVKGNRFYTRDKVLQEAGLSYETRYILWPSFFIEWKLKQDPLIKSVRVQKGWDGAILINIVEKTIVGYFIENEKNYAQVSDGTQLEIKSTQLAQIVNYPLIDGFSETERKKLAKSFGKSKEEVRPNIIAMISEMQPYATSYDKHMVRIMMQDGNTIFASYDAVPLLNEYIGTLKKLDKTNVCLWPDASTRSMHNESCDKKE